jgi:hypothetical protein
MTHAVTIEESDRQVILLALAVLSIQRPGWLAYLREVAKKMAGAHPDGPANCEKMFNDFRVYNMPIGLDTINKQHALKVLKMNKQINKSG